MHGKSWRRTISSRSPISVKQEYLRVMVGSMDQMRMGGKAEGTPCLLWKGDKDALDVLE